MQPNQKQIGKPEDKQKNNAANLGFEKVLRISPEWFVQIDLGRNLVGLKKDFQGPFH